MSTLKVNRIEPRTGDTVEIVGFEAPTTPVKAWVNFDGGGTVSIRDSMNVSSITDLGVGHYKVNFDSPMSNTDYAAHISVSPPTSSAVGTNLPRTAVFANPVGSSSSSEPIYVAPTVNGFTVACSVNAQQTRVDPEAVCIMVTA